LTIEALSKYRRAHSSDRPLVDNEGEEECVQIYIIPNDELDNARQHFASGRENILLGHNKKDVYAPCVNSAVVVPSMEFPEHHEVTVLFRRPSPGLILQPGRAILSLDTYTTSEKIGGSVTTRAATESSGEGDIRATQITIQEWPTVSIPSLQIASLSAARPGDVMSAHPPPLPPMKEGGTTQTTTKPATAFVSRAHLALIIEAADFAVNLNVVARREEAWIDKRGQLYIHGYLWRDLKCARVRVRPRSTNAGILDSTWTFLQDIKAAVTGEANFSALEGYFKWMTIGG